MTAKEKAKEEKTYYKYWITEYNYAMEEMKKFGINTESQTFEQCVNTLIAIIKKEVTITKL